MEGFGKGRPQPMVLSTGSQRPDTNDQSGIVQPDLLSDKEKCSHGLRWRKVNSMFEESVRLIKMQCCTGGLINPGLPPDPWQPFVLPPSLTDTLLHLTNRDHSSPQKLPRLVTQKLSTGTKR